MSTPLAMLSMITSNFETITFFDAFTVTLIGFSGTLQDLIDTRGQVGLSVDEERAIAKAVRACLVSFYTRHEHTAHNLLMDQLSDRRPAMFEKLNYAITLAAELANDFKDAEHQGTVFACASVLIGPLEVMTDPAPQPDLYPSNNVHRSPVYNNAFSFTTEGQPIHNIPVAPKASVSQGLTRNETVGATAMSRMSLSSASSSRPGTPSGLLRNGTVGATAFSRLSLSSFSDGLPGVSITEGNAQGGRRSSRSDSRRFSRMANKENME